MIYKWDCLDLHYFKHRGLGAAANMIMRFLYGVRFAEKQHRTIK